jgi:hypothetical protein
MPAQGLTNRRSRDRERWASIHHWDDVLRAAAFAPDWDVEEVELLLHLSRDRGSLAAP